MYLDLLGANHTPTALGLDRTVGGLGVGATMAQRVAMWHLEKTVGGGHRTDLHRLKQDVVLWISGHVFLFF